MSDVLLSYRGRLIREPEVAFLRELMDTSIRSPRDISRVGNLNLLGMISH